MAFPTSVDITAAVPDLTQVNKVPFRALLNNFRNVGEAEITPTGEAVADAIADLIAANGRRVIAVPVFNSDTAVATGDGKVIVPITLDVNGYNVVDVMVRCYDKGITGTTNVQVRRRRAGTDVDVLSTPVTMGDEFFARDGIINTSNDDLATGDALLIDVDTVHSGTAPNGLAVAITIARA